MTFSQLTRLSDRIRHKAAQKVQSKFVRNLGWLGLSQLFVRVSRIGATLLLPKFLTPEDYGLSALVMATYEFTLTFTQIGINAKLIQSDDDDLQELSNSSFWLNWCIYGGLFVLQCLAAFPIAWFYKDDKLILPICVMACAFLLTPIGRVQAGIIHRQNRLQVIAGARTLRYATANVLTAVFAILGFGLWAIVLPRVIAVPLEFVFYVRKSNWKLTSKFTTHRWGEILNFGSNILGISLLKTLRENLDYLIVGRFLGIEALGLYYFAYNAGLGLSLTINNSITTALYPHLCEARENLAELRSTFLSSLRTISFVIVPFVILQAVAAPFYVPLIFGEQWIPAIPILILVCVSAIPRPFDMASFFLLSAVNRPRVGLYWNIGFTAVFALALLTGVTWGAMAVAIAVLIVHYLVTPTYLLWTMRYVFNPKGKIAATV